jgi:hypothetical protein
VQEILKQYSIVDISTTEKQTVIKSAKKEATIEPETKQVSNADKESEASVDVTVKKVYTKRYHV